MLIKERAINEELQALS